MGTTTHGIVYPDASAVPSRSSLQSMANSIDSVVFADTGWASLPLATGTGSVNYRMERGVVEIRVNLNALSVPVGSSVTIVAAGGIPTAARSSTSPYFAAFSFDAVGFIQVYADGSIAIHASTAAFISASGQAVYLAG